MITVKQLTAAIDSIRALQPTYRTGGTGADGTCDCIGLIMGAMYRLGAKRYDMHSSNYFARMKTEGLQPLQSVADCYVGQVVYKARDGSRTLNARYLTGGRYYTGDKLDYYHAGYVASVSPLCIIHCTSGDGVNGITQDSKLGNWNYGGRIAGVDYSAGSTEGGTTMATLYDAKVVTDNGKGANLRGAASTSSTRLAKMPEGALVQVLEVQGEWLRVAYDGLAGYCVGDYLERIGADASQSAENAQEGGATGYGVYLPCHTLEAAKALLTTLNGGYVKAGETV